MRLLAISELERREWTESWKLPLIAAVGMAMSASPNLTLGALMTAIQEDTGWTRLQISTGTGIMSMVMITMAPLMGHAVDRFGSRRIALPGLVLFCLALGSLSITGISKPTWWAGWTFIAVSALFIKSTVWTAAVISRFNHSRGLAIAVALCGSGLASFCLPFFLTLLQQSFGWRGAYFGLAIIFALLSIPAAWRHFYDAADEKRRDNYPSALAERSNLPGLSPRQIFRSRRFAKLALSCLLVGTATTALSVHFIPILTSKGAAPLAAAGIAAGIGLSSVVGRLLTGLLLDRLNGPLIGMIGFALPVAACILLVADSDTTYAILVAILIGLAAGAEFDVIAYLSARYFGLRHYGLVFGTVVGLLSFGAGIGPMLGAFMFDQYGNYENMLLVVAPIFVVSGVLIGSLGEYPVHPTPDTAVQPPN